MSTQTAGRRTSSPEEYPALRRTTTPSSTGTAAVESHLSNALLSVGYTSARVRVSTLIREAFESADQALDSPPTNLDALMDMGDALRTATKYGAAAAALTIAAISDMRRKAGFNGVERESHATIIRQLKHPDEVRLLRSVYGPRFILVGAWAPQAERHNVELQSLKSNEPGRLPAWYDEQVSRLLARDEKDGAKHKLDLRAAFAHVSHATRRLLAMSTAWTTPPPASTTQRAYQRKQQPSLAERLGEAGVQRLITSYLRGSTAAELAETCGCSLSTVKRLLRSHNVRLDG